MLEPERWIDKRFPIAEYMDSDLLNGDWIVLLHRHDCPDCQTAVPGYEGLADSKNFALIEVLPWRIWSRG